MPVTFHDPCIIKLWAMGLDEIILVSRNGVKWINNAAMGLVYSRIITRAVFHVGNES
jgi:hypothetical protein